jgi:hypothetical protein
MVDRQPSQVHDPERVLEARVPGSWPDPRDEPKLLDALEANEGRRADQREIRLTEGDSVVEGIADGSHNRESGGGSSAWLDHGAKDSLLQKPVSVTSTRQVSSSAAWNGAGARGQV